jgi:hypothetical protein
MRDIGRRVNTIEKRLRPGKESEVRPPIVTVHCGRNATVQDKHKLGPKESWLTHKQQLQAQERANVEYLKDHPGCLPKTIRIELDADEEYRARLCEA